MQKLDNREKPFGDFLLEQLWIAYFEARKGKRKTEDEHRFELNDIENIINLRDDILQRTYKPSRGIAFIIHDPVMREIFAAPFRDRIVHHFLYNISADWWDRRFINDSYSCRVGKGTLYGQQRLAKFIQIATKNYTTKAYVIKLDLQGYFMSLKHSRLMDRVLWGLDQQFADDKGQLYSTVKFLWRQVIFDDATRDVTIRGLRSDWNGLPANKSLFKQPKGQGIVIGNLTSQLLSNIYLDQLDRFVTLRLGYKYYGRYVDDFYIIVTPEQYRQALRDISVIEDYLKTLGLTLHPKKRYIQEVHKGVPFLGVVVYPGHIVPGKRCRGKCKRALVKIAEGRGEISTLRSYQGHLAHINGKKYLETIYDSLGWDY